MHGMERDGWNRSDRAGQPQSWLGVAGGLAALLLLAVFAAAVEREGRTNAIPSAETPAAPAVRDEAPPPREGEAPVPADVRTPSGIPEGTPAIHPRRTTPDLLDARPAIPALALDESPSAPEGAPHEARLADAGGEGDAPAGEPDRRRFGGGATFLGHDLWSPLMESPPGSPSFHANGFTGTSARRSTATDTV